MLKSRADSVWRGDLFEGSGETTIESGAVPTFPVTWASRTAAHEGKTSPEELIAAAHASCFNMALSNILAGGGNPATELNTSAVATFEKVEAGWRLTKMALSVTGDVPGITADDFADAAAKAKDGCPVSNALKGNVEISVEASLA
jgi:osmotically inducible protein OsmC